VKEARQVDRALNVIAAYDGSLPLHHYLRNFFRMHPEMGSHDRRTCSALVYSWFRIGKAVMQLDAEERLACAVFLTHNTTTDAVEYLLKHFTGINSDLIHAGNAAKLETVKKNYNLNAEDFFPFDAPLSQGMNKMDYALSMLIQPDTWLRANASAADKMESLLSKNHVRFIREENRFGIESGVNLGAKGLNKEWFEVQDKCSQLTGTLFHPAKRESWYDCCAASGGKSLLLHSLEPSVKITVSDNRPAILKNLEERFRKARVGNFNIVHADLELTAPDIEKNYFDGIIADVPCSGSGTWSRTPEQLSFFNSGNLAVYSERQKKIAGNIVSLLKPAHPLIYITCSVFKEENEDVVEYICKRFGFVSEESRLFNGISSKADTMFAARLIRQ
jgi:16S rRNA (cytosine967-C5)-methyltransferase